MEFGKTEKECYKCGILESKALLYKGISKSEGIVSVCRKCYFKEKIPLIEKKEPNLEKINTRESVRERLSRMAHINNTKKEGKKISYKPEDVNLKDLVERNFKKEVSEGIKSPPDLVDNFHWVVMRKRRALKVTKEKLAEEVMVTPLAIESLEMGILPKDYKPLIKKVEGRLGIRLFKTSEIDHNNIINESRVPSGILIEDIKKKAEKDKESYIDVSDLSLDKINEIYGVPSEIEKTEEEKNKKDEKKEDEKKEDGKEKEYFKFKNPFSMKRFFSKKPEEKPEDSPTIGELKNKNPKEDLSDEDIAKLVWGK